MRAFTLLPLFAVAALSTPIAEPVPAPASTSGTTQPPPTGPWTVDFHTAKGCKGDKSNHFHDNKVGDCIKVQKPSDVKSLHVELNGWTLGLFKDDECKIKHVGEQLQWKKGFGKCSDMDHLRSNSTNENLKSVGAIMVSGFENQVEAFLTPP